MRKSVLVLLAAVLAGAPLFALDPGETELEFNGWVRYTNKATAFKVTEPSVSNFMLERGYVRLSHQWAPHLFTKFTVDIFGSDKYAEGATVRIKEAYLDYYLPIKDFNLTAGCQKHYFGLIYSWDYTNPEKQLADDRGIVASADYGITLNGFLPSGLGELQVGVYNGEGYKYAGKYVNTSPELLGNLRLTPFGGVQIGASVFSNESDRAHYKNDQSKGTLSSDKKKVFLPDTANKSRFGLAPMLRVAVGPNFSVTGEYIGYNYTREYGYYKADSAAGGKVTDSTRQVSTKKYEQSGIDVMPLLVLPGRKVEVFARFSMWERKEEHDGAMQVALDKSFMRYGAGFNYHFARRPSGKPGAAFQFAWSREQAKKEGSDPVDTFIAQLRLEWNRVFGNQ